MLGCVITNGIVHFQTQRHWLGTVCLHPSGMHLNDRLPTTTEELRSRSEMSRSLKLNSTKILVLRLISYAQKTRSADRPVFFSNSTYHTNYSNIL